ncbi:uncharacterized protein LOC143033531 [Oratosquilla oratoria]|uniref:uncharacterized protein LOC143033531 n=1 Tax=Oratosquilla oratoria TaxID=337810 RepID=UPI003F761D6C
MDPRLQISAHIEQRYGVDVINKARKWECSKLKKSIHREKLRFCYMCHILPTFAKVRPSVNTKKGKEEAVACRHRLLKCAIDHHHRRIHRFNGDITACKEICKARLHLPGFDALLEKIKSLSRTKAETKRTLLDSKLQRLEDSMPPISTRWVANLSNLHLTPEEKQVLSKGLNFNVQGGVNRAEFLAAAELGISLIDSPEEVKQAARTKNVGDQSSTLKCHEETILKRLFQATRADLRL